MLSFDFTSENGNTGQREIKPYMVYLNEKDEIKVVGLPKELWNKPEVDRQPRHYLLHKIDLNQFRVLDETFDDPDVPRDIVVSTKKVKIICRFIYPDEDEQEVMKSWVKVAGLKL